MGNTSAVAYNSVQQDTERTTDSASPTRRFAQYYTNQWVEDKDYEILSQTWKKVLRSGRCGSSQKESGEAHFWRLFRHNLCLAIPSQGLSYSHIFTPINEGHDKDSVFAGTGEGTNFVVALMRMKSDTSFFLRAVTSTTHAMMHCHEFKAQHLTQLGAALCWSLEDCLLAAGKPQLYTEELHFACVRLFSTALRVMRLRAKHALKEATPPPLDAVPEASSGVAAEIAATEVASEENLTM